MNENTFSAGFVRELWKLCVSQAFQTCRCLEVDSPYAAAACSRPDIYLEVILSRLWTNELPYLTSGSAFIIYTQFFALLLSQEWSDLKLIVLQI